MSNTYRQWSIEEKRKYGKQFSASERKAYHAGKRNGFLDGVHAPSKVRNKPVNNFTGRKYSDEDFEKLFTTLGEVKI